MRPRISTQFPCNPVCAPPAPPMCVLQEVQGARVRAQGALGSADEERSRLQREAVMLAQQLEGERGELDRSAAARSGLEVCGSVEGRGGPIQRTGQESGMSVNSWGLGDWGPCPLPYIPCPPPPSFPPPPPSPLPPRLLCRSLPPPPPPPVRWRWAACDRSCLSSLPTRPCSRTGWQRRPRGWPTARRHSTAPPGTSRGCRCGVHTTGPRSLLGGLSPWWAFYTHSIVAIALCRMSHTDHAYHMNALELASVPMREAPGSHT